VANTSRPLEVGLETGRIARRLQLNQDLTHEGVLLAGPAQTLGAMARAAFSKASPRTTSATCSAHHPRARELGWCWCGGGQPYGRRFDHISASESLSAVGCRFVHGVCEDGLSDHSAIMADNDPPTWRKPQFLSPCDEEPQRT